MSDYLLLKTLHILSSTVLFGLGAGSAYYSFRAWRSGKVEVIAVTFRHLVFADWAFTTTSAIFQPLSGLALVWMAGWPLYQSWLLWTFGLYVLAGLCWLPVVWLQIRVREMAERALRENTPMPMTASTYIGWWFCSGSVAFSAFVVIFFLMVWKPA